jgi:hypothetical protein
VIGDLDALGGHRIGPIIRDRLRLDIMLGLPSDARPGL